GRGPQLIEVFAVEDTTAQLVWRRGPDGPGSRIVEDLPPGATTAVEVDRPGARIQRVEVTTLPALPGPELSRIATVSDVHVGLDSFGFLKTIRERGTVRRANAEPPSLRCLRAALAEAVAWGAQLVVVKGDLTDRGRVEEWEAAAARLHEIGVPVVVLPGNHDVHEDAEISPAGAGRAYDLRVVDAIGHVDVPGARVVLAATAQTGHHRGVIDAELAGRIAEEAAGGPVAIVLLHHQLEDRPEPPFWPPGIVRDDSERFLDQLAAAQPRSLVTSGHTHRNRRRTHGPVTVTTVGSTKDYPGTWAGYVIHASGIRQVVRRVAAPDCLRWTEMTRRGAAHLWPRMAEGRLDDRCFTVRWDEAPTSSGTGRITR
ncbi:MAG: metallophosphoesterase, partial [Acidimicrobiia bacterium]|nr:metallophosphoesterase [Acidimicrobiia bacterium]